MADTVSPSWWKDYFSSHYGRLYRGPLAVELSTAEEVEGLQRVFADVKGPIVDVGCGHGRHLSALRNAGIDAIGIDYSFDLLQMVAKKHRKALARADMRSLPFRTESLAGACLLFNTFGYFSDEENAGVLRELARVLRPGAKVVMELPARAGMKAAVTDLPASMRIQEGTSIYEHWQFDEATKRLRSEGRWVLDDDRQDWEMSLRLYSPAELERLLRKAGLKVLELREGDDWESVGTDAESLPPSASAWRSIPGMIVLAQKT